MAKNEDAEQCSVLGSYEGRKYKIVFNGQNPSDFNYERFPEKYKSLCSSLNRLLKEVGKKGNLPKNGTRLVACNPHKDFLKMDYYKTEKESNVLTTTKGESTKGMPALSKMLTSLIKPPSLCLYSFKRLIEEEETHPKTSLVAPFKKAVANPKPRTNTSGNNSSLEKLKQLICLKMIIANLNIDTPDISNEELWAIENSIFSQQDKENLAIAVVDKRHFCAHQIIEETLIKKTIASGSLNSILDLQNLQQFVKNDLNLKIDDDKINRVLEELNRRRKLTLPQRPYLLGLTRLISSIQASVTPVVVVCLLSGLINESPIIRWVKNSNPLPLIKSAIAPKMEAIYLLNPRLAFILCVFSITIPYMLMLFSKIVQQSRLSKNPLRLLH